MIIQKPQPQDDYPDKIYQLCNQMHFLRGVEELNSLTSDYQNELSSFGKTIARNITNMIDTKNMQNMKHDEIIAQVNNMKKLSSMLKKLNIGGFENGFKIV